MTTPILILAAALANSFLLANVVFERFKAYLPTKPFRCIPCLTAWIALLLALFGGQGVASVLYIGAGYMFGSIYSAIQMRYL